MSRSEEVRDRKVASLQALCLSILDERFVLDRRYYWCRKASSNSKVKGYSPPLELTALSKAGILERKHVGSYQPLGQKLPKSWFTYHNSSVYVYGEAKVERLEELARDKEVATSFLFSSVPLPPTPSLEEAVEMVRLTIAQDANPRKKFLEIMNHVMPEFE